jgi:hypothetical protein
VKEFWAWTPFLTLIPVTALWIFGYVIAWIRSGFIKGNHNI